MRVEVASANPGSGLARTAPLAILPAVEQRFGPNIMPAQAAGTDPSHVPGLTVPRQAGAEEATHEPTAERPREAVAPFGEAPAGREPQEAPEEAPEDGFEDGFEELVDGPVFDVSDRRASITANRTGMRFRLDGDTAEFCWDEIGAVEMNTPRFARVFSVTIHTVDRRRYQADIEAPARSLPKQWASELDAVLDLCFEDGES